MKANSVHQLRREFDLTSAMASWIVVTHVFVLACPLLMIWAVDKFSGQLSTPFVFPTLIHIASAVYICATAFEVAQNSADRWYLTEATRSVADLLFNTFLTFAFWLYAVGFLGLGWWAAVAAVFTLLYPFAYIWNHPSHRGLTGAVVLIATMGLYQVTADPTVFLFIAGNGAGVYFILLLTRQHAQVMHGWAALSFGAGFLAWPWAVVNAAQGTQISWLALAIIVGAIGLVLAALTPLLTKLPATPHRHT